AGRKAPSQSVDCTVRPTPRDFILHTHSLAGYNVIGVYTGETVTGVLQLSLPAPPGGRLVQVTSQDTAAAVNPTVGIPGGQNAVEIPIPPRLGVTGQAIFEATTPTSEVATQMTIVPSPRG